MADYYELLFPPGGDLDRALNLEDRKDRSRGEMRLFDSVGEAFDWILTRLPPAKRSELEAYMRPKDKCLFCFGLDDMVAFLLPYTGPTRLHPSSPVLVKHHVRVRDTR